MSWGPRDAHCVAKSGQGPGHPAAGHLQIEVELQADHRVGEGGLEEARRGQRVDLLERDLPVAVGIGERGAESHRKNIADVGRHRAAQDPDRDGVGEVFGRPGVERAAELAAAAGDDEEAVEGVDAVGEINHGGAAGREVEGGGGRERDRQARHPELEGNLGGRERVVDHQREGDRPHDLRVARRVKEGLRQGVVGEQVAGGVGEGGQAAAGRLARDRVDVAARSEGHRAVEHEAGRREDDVVGGRGLVVELRLGRCLAHRRGANADDRLRIARPSRRDGDRLHLEVAVAIVGHHGGGGGTRASARQIENRDRRGCEIRLARLDHGDRCDHAAGGRRGGRGVLVALGHEGGERGRDVGRDRVVGRIGGCEFLRTVAHHDLCLAGHRGLERPREGGRQTLEVCLEDVGVANRVGQRERGDRSVGDVGEAEGDAGGFPRHEEACQRGGGFRAGAPDREAAGITGGGRVVDRQLSRVAAAGDAACERGGGEIGCQRRRGEGGGDAAVGKRYLGGRGGAGVKHNRHRAEGALEVESRSDDFDVGEHPGPGGLRARHVARGRVGEARTRAGRGQQGPKRRLPRGGQRDRQVARIGRGHDKVGEHALGLGQPVGQTCQRADIKGDLGGAGRGVKPVGVGNQREGVARTAAGRRHAEGWCEHARAVGPVDQGVEVGGQFADQFAFDTRHEELRKPGQVLEARRHEGHGSGEQAGGVGGREDTRHRLEGRCQIGRVDKQQPLGATPGSIGERRGKTAPRCRARREGQLWGAGKLVADQGGHRVAHGHREGQVIGVDGRGRRGARPQQLVAGEDRLPAAERLKTPGRGLERERHLGREVFGGERHVEIAHLGRAGEAGGSACADEVHGEVDIAERHRTDGGDRPGRGGEERLAHERVV